MFDGFMGVFKGFLGGFSVVFYGFLESSQSFFCFLGSSIVPRGIL